MDEVIPLLTEASRLRPTFESAADLEQPPVATWISTTGSPPKLIGLPSFFVGAGPHQFARFAQGLGGARSVAALSLPGFGRGEPVPASWSAAIEALAESARQAAGDDPFVLVGFSIGGSLAHAVAERLEREGPAPAGVVLIDTYLPQASRVDEAFSSVMEQLLDGGSLIAIDDDSLLAVGSYLRLLAEWEPAPIEAPRLLLRATEPLGDAFERERLHDWQAAETVVDVPSTHFGLIGENAEATARATEDWLAETIGLEPTLDESGAPS